MLSHQSIRNVHNSILAFRDPTAKSFTPTPSPVRTPAQSDNEGEEGEGGEDEGVPDVSMEQVSGGSGAIGKAARPIAGTVKKKKPVSWAGGCAD